LQRGEVAPVNLAKLLATVVAVQNETRQADIANVSLTFEGGGPPAFVVPGHDSRLGQVVNNLIDNARSFAPAATTVRVTCRRVRDEVEIVVDDDGPGIRPDAFDKIFERFYTDRPHQGFGQNSGLGLSISKQIIEAHSGRVWAENRLGVPVAEGEPRVLGARFTVRLPAA
jgi:two-component system sensor histidine kinase ChvG